MRIQTAEYLFDLHTESDYHAWLMSRRSTIQRARDLGIDLGKVGTPSHVDADAKPAVAYVNHGRWVADCPTASCGGSLALLDQAQGFMCGNCLNIEVDSLYRPVVWPDERERIEAALSVRLLPERANWRDESVGDLVAENVTYGIGAL